MGYSVAVPVKDAKAKKKMLAFMGKNYKPMSELLGEENDYASNPTGDMSYDRGHKLRIGFDYNSCSPERDYIYAVIRWMSLRVGKRKKMEVFEGSGIFGLIPYYVYDGYEDTPIRLSSEWEKVAPVHKGPGDWTFTDEDGWSEPDDISLGIFKLCRANTWEEELNKMHDELKRLSKLWDELS